MSKLPNKPMKQMHSRRWCKAALALTVTLSLAAAYSARATVTNAIWTANAQGKMVIQGFDQRVVPIAKTASFKNRNFLEILIGRTPDATEKLALNIDMANNTTNFYLTVFSTSSRGNSFRVTTGEKTTLFQDSKQVVFTTEASVLPVNSNLGGGSLRITGKAKLVNGVPSKFKAAVEGVLVDTRPGDLQGTTGLVVRAKINTLGAPLRIQPPRPADN